MGRKGSATGRVGLGLAPAGLCASGWAPLREDVCESPWRLEETLRLGSADGDVALNTVNDLAVGPAGKIYLLQGWDPILVFWPDGRPAGAIGRSGEGPGEFASPLRRLGWRGDTLWVSHRLATQFLSADGKEIRRVRFSVPLASEGSILAPGTPLADGTFLPRRMVTENELRLKLAGRVPLRRLSALGAIIDTLAVVERHLASFSVVREIDRNGWGVRTEHPLGPWRGESWLPVAVDPDGTAIVLLGEMRDDHEKASFELLRIRFDGDTLLRRTIPYKRRRISAAEQRRQREVFASRMAEDRIPQSRRRLSPSESERRRRIGGELITFPDFYPPVRRIVAGGDGSMWLLREAWPSLADIWEIYGEDGELEGSVRIEGPPDHENWNPRLRILRARRTEVWGMTLGAFNVPYVHRFRVDRSCN